MRRTLLAALAGVVLAMAGSAGAASDRDVAVELSAEKSDFDTSENVPVGFTVHNGGPRSRSLYVWDTPLAGVENDLFLVTRDGERVAYLGYIAKRGRPTKADHVRLGRGERLSASVDLSSLYDMTQPGEYAVRYRFASSNVLTLRVSGERNTGRTSEKRPGGGGPPPPPPGTTVYRSCRADQIADLQQALPAAQTYANQANASLTGTITARYTTWFGAYTASRYDRVQGNFQHISAALGTQAITFDCGCKQSYYAYVYPSRPYEIFLCRVFWTAPMTGTDSKAGTIIHETSHFTVVAGTDDWAYGQSACRSLAVSNPDRAIDNADTHEYYAENNPPQ